MRRTVTTEKELVNAIKDDEVSEIEITGELKDKVFKIKAKGKVAWAVAFGAIAVVVLIVVTSPTTVGTQNLLALPALAPAISVLGAGATLTAVKIAAFAGGAAALTYIRDDMNVIDQGPNYIVLKKESAAKYFSKVENFDSNKAETMFKMGKDYYEGTGGMPKNKDMAIYCLKQAGEMGSEKAKQYLSTRGYQFFEVSASNISSNSEAERLYSMGINYIEGTGGMPKNKDMAIYCLKQAGEMGSEEAKRYLRNLGYQFY